MSFLVAGPNGSVWTWLSFAAFCTFGYCGANFGAALTMQVPRTRSTQAPGIQAFA